MPPAASMLILAPAFACAALVGFAAHRASLCNVRAVVEIMSSGTAHMLGSLMQAALWMALLAGGLTLLAGHSLPSVRMLLPAAWALWGGWLFGVGAAINGGCSLSTLHRLADGELGMLATLLGFALGVVSLALAWAGPWASGGMTGPGELTPLTTFWVRWPALAPWVLLTLALWAVSRVATLWRLARSSPSASIGRRVLAPQYHLTVSAALMGLAGGVLFATQGAWSYTSHLRTSVLHAWAGSPAPAGTHSALVIALALGMVASAVQRGSVQWRRPRSAASWLRHLGGGMLMGAGAAMVPGGNDTLLLNALPTLALQAVGAYAAMLGGITTVLGLMRFTRMPMPSTRCTEAGCAEARSPTGP